MPWNVVLDYACAMIFGDLVYMSICECHCARIFGLRLKALNVVVLPNEKGKISRNVIDLLKDATSLFQITNSC